MTYRKRTRPRMQATVDPQRLPTLGVSHLWADVPADVIKDLVVRYAAMGDAILFGTSQSQEVLAVRVYRKGSGASVYSRTVRELDDALGRLEELVPTFARCHPLQAVPSPLKQVESVAEPTPQGTSWDEFNCPIAAAERKAELRAVLADRLKNSKYRLGVDKPY